MTCSLTTSRHTGTRLHTTTCLQVPCRSADCLPSLPTEIEASRIVPPPVTREDFLKSLRTTRPTVSEEDLLLHVKFTQAHAVCLVFWPSRQGGQPLLPFLMIFCLLLHFLYYFCVFLCFCICCVFPFWQTFCLFRLFCLICRQAFVLCLICRQANCALRPLIFYHHFYWLFVWKWLTRPLDLPFLSQGEVGQWCPKLRHRRIGKAFFRRH